MIVSADFVIVGAGSAGCVLANRLSKDHRVILIEAGGSDQHLLVRAPAAFSRLFRTKRDWDFWSEPEPAAGERKLYLPRGKMLGGSSSMNAMIYMRGRPSDYDGWVGSGAIGWGWERVLSIFKAHENNSRGPSEFHGVGGPVHVSDLVDPSPFSMMFLEAAASFGIHPNGDFNGVEQTGFGLYQVTQLRGRRWSAADAFLHPLHGRANLVVRTRSMVDRVRIEGTRATGIYLTGADGSTEFVAAERAVVLAAGALGSPALLQRSGIGDPDRLRQLGINPVMPLPQVGENLQDHPVAGIVQRSTRKGTVDDARKLGSLVEFVTKRSGLLTSNVGEGGAFVTSDPSLAEPDLQIYFGPAYFRNHGFDNFRDNAFSLGPCLLTPRSRGSVHVKSSDPGAPPSIVGNYLRDPADVERLLVGLKMARAIMAQPAFDNVRGEELYPGADVTGDDDLRTAIRENAELLYHPGGTCRIGPPDEGVVDPSLAVHGLDRLFVVDASVMPTLPAGNIHAPTMVIGELGAHLILSRT